MLKFSFMTQLHSLTLNLCWFLHLAYLPSCALARLLPQWRHQDTVHAAVSRLTASFSWSSNLRIHTGETPDTKIHRTNSNKDRLKNRQKTATKIHNFEESWRIIHFGEKITWDQGITSQRFEVSHLRSMGFFVEKTKLRLGLPVWPDPAKDWEQTPTADPNFGWGGGVGGAKTCDPCSQKLSKDLQFVWSLLVCFLHRGKNLTKKNSISKLHTPRTSHCLGMISTFNSLKSKLNSLVPPKPGFHELLLKLFLNRTFKMF